MVRVIWNDRALEELREIRDYLESRSPDAMRSVCGGIYSTVQQLAGQPRLGWREAKLEDREVRNLLYGRYRIIYEVLDNETTIRVLMIRHTSRDSSNLDL